MNRFSELPICESHSADGERYSIELDPDYKLIAQYVPSNALRVPLVPFDILVGKNRHDRFVFTDTNSEVHEALSIEDVARALSLLYGCKVNAYLIHHTDYFFVAVKHEITCITLGELTYRIQEYENILAPRSETIYWGKYLERMRERYDVYPLGDYDRELVMHPAEVMWWLDHYKTAMKEPFVTQVDTLGDKEVCGECPECKKPYDITVAHGEKTASIECKDCWRRIEIHII